MTAQWNLTVRIGTVACHEELTWIVGGSLAFDLLRNGRQETFGGHIAAETAGGLRDGCTPTNEVRGRFCMHCRGWSRFYLIGNKSEEGS